MQLPGVSDEVIQPIKNYKQLLGHVTQLTNLHDCFCNMDSSLATLLLHEVEDSAQPPSLVEPLVKGLKGGISCRFGNIITNTDAQLAAVVTPQFKFYWLEDKLQKAHTLKARVRAISEV